MKWELPYLAMHKTSLNSVPSLRSKRRSIGITSSALRPSSRMKSNCGCAWRPLARPCKTWKTSKFLSRTSISSPLKRKCLSKSTWHSASVSLPNKNLRRKVFCRSKSRTLRGSTNFPQRQCRRKETKRGTSSSSLRRALRDGWRRCMLGRGVLQTSPTPISRCGAKCRTQWLALLLRPRNLNYLIKSSMRTAALWRVIRFRKGVEKLLWGRAQLEIYISSRGKIAAGCL